MTPFYANWIFWLYFAAWLPFIGTAITYGFGSRWWTSHIGRSLLLTKVSIILLLGNVLLSLAIPNSPGERALIRVVLVGIVIIAGWYQYGAILRETIKAHRAPVLVEETP